MVLELFSITPIGRKNHVTLNRSRKYARKAREYKLTYSFLAHLSNKDDVSAAKKEIEHITRVFKAHRSAIDADKGFIVNS